MQHFKKGKITSVVNFKYKSHVSPWFFKPKLLSGHVELVGDVAVVCVVVICDGVVMAPVDVIVGDDVVEHREQSGSPTKRGRNILYHHHKSLPCYAYM